MSVGRFVCALALALLVPAGGMAAPMSDQELRQALRERIDVQRQGASIVVGIVEPQGTRIVSHGLADRASRRRADADTVYEIGSVTKVFTALLLADMASRNEVRADRPVREYLPLSVRFPAGEREITLHDLAWHESGLPREAENRRADAEGRPTRPYRAGDMYAFLSDYRLRTPIGTPHYSNLGYSLLGHVLALRAGTDYDSLIRARIAGPLGMRATGVHGDAAMQRRRATGYRQDGSIAPSYNAPELSGDGALQSSMNDMLRFLSACMQASPSPVDRAVTHARAAGREGTPAGWDRLKTADADIRWKNGRTYGFSSFIGYDTRSGVGVVVLSNSTVAVDDLGLKALNSRFRLKQLVVPPSFARDQEWSGFRQVIAAYRAFRYRNPAFRLEEEPLNEWAYALLKEGRRREAIELFKLGVHIRPRSANAYDSLAEGYEKDGQVALAVSNYRTSLQFWPGNQHAIERLAALTAQGAAAD